MQWRISMQGSKVRSGTFTRSIVQPASAAPARARSRSRAVLPCGSGEPSSPRINGMGMGLRHWMKKIWQDRRAGLSEGGARMLRHLSEAHNGTTDPSLIRTVFIAMVSGSSIYTFGAQGTPVIF